MGVRNSKAKKKQETFNAWEANKKIEELTRNLESQENNLAETNQTVKTQKESINVRDQDIRNLQDAIIERDNILKGVKWALSLETPQPWSPKPVLRSKRPKEVQGENPQANPPQNEQEESSCNRLTEKLVRADMKVPAPPAPKISNDKTFC